MHAIQLEFHEYSDPVFQIVKKAFMNFKHPVDFRSYCNNVNKLISIDMKQIKEMYFNILDLNKDKRICETDLFNSMQSITTNSVSDLLVDDIVLILKEIDNRRIKEEKTDEIAMVKKKIMNNANYALNNK